MAWVIIATTTALSDIIARWLTSNIADAPPRPQRSKSRDGQDSENNHQGFQTPVRRRRGARILRAVIGGVPAEEETEFGEDFNTNLDLDSALDVSTEDENEHLNMTSTTEFEETGEESTDIPTASQEDAAGLERRRRRRRKRRKASEVGSTRIRSRRVFHWDVAVRRNVLPVCALGYVTMVVLLLLE